MQLVIRMHAEGVRLLSAMCVPNMRIRGWHQFCDWLFWMSWQHWQQW
jgi:hypothetical protein